MRGAVRTGSRLTVHGRTRGGGGGVGGAEVFGNFSGALMVLPVMLLVACWFRILSVEGNSLLRHHVVLTPYGDQASRERQGA